MACLPPIDFETYSEAGFTWDSARGRWASGKRGLSAVGLANYARHPSTEVLCMAYGLGSWQLWHPGMPPPQDLFDYLAKGGLVEAWNSSFELWVWNEVCANRYGWPALRAEQIRCAMAKSRHYSLPGGLALVGDVLGIEYRKDKDGTRLLNKFSIPRNPTKGDPRTRIRPEDDPEDALRLYAYCLRDVVAEMEVSERTPDLLPMELAYWQTDQRINRRGVQVDAQAVGDCAAIVSQCVEQYDAQLEALAGCKTSELQQLRGWLAAHGVHTDTLDADAVTTLLEDESTPAMARRALELRAKAGSASVKKVYAMRDQMTAEGRLHNLYNYHGARTGRPTGEGPQPTNLPREGPNVYRCGTCGRHFGSHRVSCPWCGQIRPPGAAGSWSPEAAEDAITVISWRSLDALEAIYGDAMLTVAGCLRGLFVATPGSELVSSDYTAIEGVVIACLAGEQWRVDAFAEGAPMYLLSAERMYGVSVAEMQAYAKEHGKHHHLRQKGKGGELGLGFGGWINALRQFGVDGPDDELKETVLKWRAASPAIEWFWGGQTKGAADSIRKIPGANRWDKTPHLFGLEGAAIRALQSPNIDCPVMRLDGTACGIIYRHDSERDVLRCTVPSGGHITYHRVRLESSEKDWRGLSIQFEGYNTNPKQGMIGWVTMYTYGGKLAENVTQRVARDIQMHAIEQCERAGYPVVLHTYDEIVCEGVGLTVEGLERIMCDVPLWARGWPIKAAGGWCGNRYRKG